MERLQSLCGALAILGLAFLLSPRGSHKRLLLRPLLSGSALLIALAALVLKSPARVAFAWANDAVEHLLRFSGEGARFVFGKLVDVPGFGYVFAFQVLPTIVFFGALMSVLYHLGVMPFIIDRGGRALSRALGTSGAESFSTVADIFVGQTEAPLVIRPYLAKLSDSEIFACMTAGFATTAGGVLAAYVQMLGPLVPGIAGHLLACSVMCAPASLMIAKLMLPPSAENGPAAEAHGPERSQYGNAAVAPQRTTVNLVDAVTQGALDGLGLAINVGAMLVAFVALTAALDFALGRLGQLLSVPLSLAQIAGYLFAPLAWLIGVPSEEALKVGSLLGEKTVLNEFVAYAHLTERLTADPRWLSERSRLLSSYALCGFANFGSVGIQIGGYTALAPERRPTFAKLALRAMIGGMLTTALVAAVAGVML